MNNEWNIIKEVQFKAKFTSPLIFQKFEDSSFEEEYIKYENITFSNKGTIITCILLFLSHSFNIYYIPNRTNRSEYSIPCIIFMIIDLSLAIAYFNLNTSKNIFLINLVKILSNIFYFFWCFIVYMLYVAKDKQSSLLYCFLLQSMLLYFEYMFIFQHSSKLLCFIIYFGYLILYLIASFSTYSLTYNYHNAIINKTSLNELDKECNSLVDYWNILSDTSFNIDYINIVLEYYQDSFDFTEYNLLKDSFTNNITQKNTFKEILNHHNNATNSNSNDISYGCNNNDQYNDLLKFELIDLYKNISLEEGSNELHCLNFYYSDMFKYFFSAHPLYSIDVSKRNLYFKYSSEIVLCFG